MDNIYQKISKVMKEIEYLTKDDNVSTGGSGSYKAISEEKVTTVVRQSLIKNGIVIIPIKQDHRREDEKLTDKYDNEKLNRLTTVDVTYRIQNIEDKEDYIEAVSSGTGVDTQDKGIGKAITYSYKYLLLRVFAIPTGEDADKVSSDVYSEQFKKTVTKKEDIKETLDEGTKKISKTQEDALRLAISNNGISNDYVIAMLQKYKYKKLSDIEIKNYMSIYGDLSQITV